VSSPHATSLPTSEARSQVDLVASPCAMYVLPPVLLSGSVCPAPGVDLVLSHPSF
jgi:hypothetical protein